MNSKHAVAVGTEQVTAAPITGLRRGALLGYRWALLAFLLAGVAQIFLAGLGAFRLQPVARAVYGALHGLDGLLILGIAACLYFWSRRREW
jgi:hypothetical protein